MLPKKKTPPKQSLTDLTVLMYGPSKIGKSTWCSNAENAVFLATEAGLNSLDVYQVPVLSWEDLLTASKELVKGDHNFKTVIIDTVDNAYKMCGEYICGQQGIEHESDLGYGKGWALVNNEFHRVLTKLSLLPYGLFLISHSIEREIETRTVKRTRIVPTLPDRARKIVLELVDMILFCDMEMISDETGGSEYKRIVRTKPHIDYEAGDRTGKLPDTLDLDFKAFIEAFRAPTASPDLNEAKE